MDGDLKIEKINFENSEPSPTKKNLENDGNPQMKFKKDFLKTRNAKILAGVVVFLLLFAVLVGFKTIKIFADAQKTYKQAKIAVSAIKKQNIIVAKSELIKTNTKKTIPKNKKCQDFSGCCGISFTVCCVGWI